MIKIAITAFWIMLSGSATSQQARMISEERFQVINGTEQWITIKGNRDKPVILFLHGGPGSPMSPYADNIYKDWEKDFLLVQWDQRGTARTFGKNGPGELNPEFLRSNPLTLQQVTDDGIALIEYLLQYLGKKKLILFGTSWGSVPGLLIAQKAPHLLYAYIGHSQVIHPHVADKAAYTDAMKIATDRRDSASIAILQKIGMPPYDTARHAGQLLRVVKKYQQQKETPPPPGWFNIDPDYDNKKDAMDRENGDDYSFVHYTGDKKLGISAMNAGINFHLKDLHFSIPVYFIQGKQDLQTQERHTRAFYKKISAPRKKMVVLPNTAHGFNEQVIAAHLEILRKNIVPLINE